MKLKSKKAQIFAVFLVLTFLIAGIYIIFLAIKGKADFSSNLQSPAKIDEMNNNADKFMLFAKESGKLAIVQAYYEIVSAPDFKFAGNCDVQEGYIELCSISDNTDNDFATKISENIAKYLDSYKDEQFKAVKYSISISNDIINFNSEKINLHTQTEQGFFPFGAVYNFNPSFSVSLSNLDLDNMAKAVGTSQNCFLERKSSDITECMKQLKNFDFALNFKDDKTFFDLTTKKRFFYTQDSNSLYEKITVRFFIKD